MPQPTLRRCLLTLRLLGLNWRRTAAVVWISVFSVTTYSQGTFVSGSTGADGPFNPTANVTVPLPESGVLNFTTVNIPAGVTVRFGKNSRNAPVTLLATGNVAIAGTIDVSGLPGTPALGGAGGPGGFNGGSGGPAGGIVNNSYQNLRGVNGDGPGGGGSGGSETADKVGTGGGGGFGNPGLPGSYPDVINGTGGPKYGLPSLLPLIGGSGGGGETGSHNPGAGGGGGGGALLIASSGTISFIDDGQTRIAASGGNGFSNVIGSGGGSGGAVRLIANTLSGTLRINAGGGSASYGGAGGGGYVRLEALDVSSLVVALVSGSPRVTTATPGVVTPTNLPVIRIVTVAGIAPPNQPNGSLQGGPDIILPTNQANPVNVSLSAANIPLGTTLQVTLTPEKGARVVTQSSALAGTVAASTATASISLPDGICVIQASGTIDVGASNLMINGEKVSRIEVNAVFGGNQTVTYITASNKRIKADQ